MHHWYIYGGLWHRHSRRFLSKKSGWTGWGNLTYYYGVYPDSRHIPYRLYSPLLLPIQRKKPFHVWHLNCCLANIFMFSCYKLHSSLSFTTAAISTDYFDFTFKRYGNIASIFFNKCKKDLPVNTPIVFDIPVGYRPCWMVTQMQSCGRQKLTTYYCSSSDGNAGIIIYDGLAKDIGIYAEFFYFCAT